MLLAAMLALGCAPSPTPTPTSTPLPSPSPAPTAEIAVTPTTVVQVQASEAVSLTAEPVKFPEGTDARPGPWSPVGDAMIAYLVVRDGAALGPVGRLWTVDVEKAEPLWDSGDMQEPIRRTHMADWLGDGTLVLARQDGMFVSSDGIRSVQVSGLSGQPRSVTASPDGTTAFVNGPEGSWLIGSDGTARTPQGLPPLGFDSWEWRADSRALALAVSGGEYFVMSAVADTVEKFAQAPSIAATDPVPPPRWLSDGRVLLSDATRVSHGGAKGYGHRVADPVSAVAASLTELIGIAPNPWMPSDASSWVSRDGRYVLYPQYVRVEASSEVQLADTWLLSVETLEARQMGPIQDPVWAPSAERFAYRDGGMLALWVMESETSYGLVTGDLAIEHLCWSPDSRWILYTTSDGAFWIVAGDGHAGPARLASEVAWDPAPTWSPTGDRFAASMTTDGGPPILTLVTVE